MKGSEEIVNTPKFCFVILHYLNVMDTKECVESILNNIVYENVHVVIVDNGSPNHSGDILQDSYKDNLLVDVIINENNLGFAKGNNIGFQYAKYVLKSEYIILINNDTKIVQNNFCDSVIKIFEKTDFDILGPKIISLVDKKNQNPVPYTFKNNLSIVKRILNYTIKYAALFIPYIKNINLESRYDSEAKINLSDYQLHGCCLIFSKNYISIYDGLCPRTFMYCEEDFLKYYAVKYDLKMLYSSNIEIFHKEGSATKSLNNSSIESMRFFYKNNIISLFKLFRTRIKSIKMFEEEK